MNELLLQQCINKVDGTNNETLPHFSHSKLEVFENCVIRYDLQYNQKKRSNDTTLSLEIGTLTHKVLEEKGKMLFEGKEVDYEKLNDILINGCIETDEKTKETIRGIKALKKTYFEEWYQSDNASGMTYDDKMKKFDEVLHTEMEDDGWKPAYFELPFEFVWRDKYIISGFIDRVDEKDGEYRVVDYKSSKKIFDSKKLPTAQQMGIYGCAILCMFGKLPKEYKYRFTLINDEQYAMTKNWETRIIKKLDKVFESIEESNRTRIYKPSPSPLCYYCPYCINNPNAKEYSRECEYYSLWQPNNKTYEVNRQFEKDDLKNNLNSTKLNTDNTKMRKLIF